MPKILVVDDSVDIKQLLKMMLEAKKYNVALASSKTEVVETLTTDTVDLILLDVQLGGEDGRTICKEIKERYKDDVPVILISARSDLLEHYKEYHADAAIEKPFDMQTLMDKVNALLPTN